MVNVLTCEYIVPQVYVVVKIKITRLCGFVCVHKKEVKFLDTITIIINELKLQHKTQKDLMDFLNAHPNVFSEWKAGRSKSYIKYIYQIAAFLDVSPEYLRGETQQKKPAFTGELSDNDTFKLYKELSPELQKQVDDFLLYLVQKNKGTGDNV